MEIVADSHERYPYRFTGQQVTVVRRALPCGDYGLAFGGRLVASVERKSVADLATSLEGLGRAGPRQARPRGLGSLARRSLRSLARNGYLISANLSSLIRPKIPL